MPRRKPKKQNLTKEQELDMKKKLDSIVLADEMLSGLGMPDIPPIRDPRVIDTDGVKSEVEAEARSIMKSLSEFYHDAADLSEESYIRNKQKIDALSISTMAFQIRTAQHAITKLIEEIDASAGADPRLFMVLAQLQSQIMQMPKNFSTYMNQMEKNYKDLKKESEEMKKGENLQFDENGNLMETPENIDALKVRGTKSLMENLQHMMKNQNNIKDAEIVEKKEPQSDLINPRTKDGGTSELGLDDDEIDFEIDEDIF